MGNKHIGSSFNDFLQEDSLLKDAESTAIKRLIAWQIQETMKAKHITKNRMATLMKTSRSQVDRFLNPNNTKIQLDTMERAAAAVGCRLVITLEPATSGEASPLRV